MVLVSGEVGREGAGVVGGEDAVEGSRLGSRRVKQKILDEVYSSFCRHKLVKAGPKRREFIFYCNAYYYPIPIAHRPK